MKTESGTSPDLGQGVYTFPEAAAIIRRRPEAGVTTRQLRYWLATGLTPDRHRVSGYSVLTFADLVSLELVRRFRVSGASLQGIRRFEETLRRDYPELRRPFAHGIFFSDGHSIWAQVNPDESTVLELRGSHPEHFAWTEVIKSFAFEIRLGPDQKATGWSLAEWVDIDPQVQFGQPVVSGTRIPVRTIAANLQVASPHDVADWYGLSAEQVTGVRKYLAA